MSYSIFSTRGGVNFFSIEVGGRAFWLQGFKFRRFRRWVFLFGAIYVSGVTRRGLAQGLAGSSVGITGSTLTYYFVVGFHIDFYSGVFYSFGCPYGGFKLWGAINTVSCTITIR